MTKPKKQDALPTVSSMRLTLIDEIRNYAAASPENADNCAAYGNTLRQWLFICNRIGSVKFGDTFDAVPANTATAPGLRIPLDDTEIPENKRIETTISVAKPPFERHHGCGTAYELLADIALLRPGLEIISQDCYLNNHLGRLSHALAELIFGKDYAERTAKAQTKLLDKLRKDLDEATNNDINKSWQNRSGEIQKAPLTYFERLLTSRYKNANQGIGYTPYPLVDFILRSVNEVCRKEFGKEINEVELLDPFSGTGVFADRAKQILPGVQIEQWELSLTAWYLCAAKFEPMLTQPLEAIAKKYA